MFLGNATGGGNKAVDGLYVASFHWFASRLYLRLCCSYSYVDDGWSTNGPSEMDKDSVAKMGMSTADVQAMISAWSANVAACEGPSFQCP
jgi:hypothetical protein